MYNGEKIRASLSINPTTAFPIDARYYFDKLTDAQTAASTAVEVGDKTGGSNYFIGETIVVVENGVATLYIITPDKKLANAGLLNITDTDVGKMLRARKVGDQNKWVLEALDEEPTESSDKAITSGAVYKCLSPYVVKVKDTYTGVANVPVYFDITPKEDIIKVHAYSIALNREKSQTAEEYTMDVPAATTTNAGLMCASDKSKLESVSVSQTEVKCGNGTFTKDNFTTVSATSTQTDAEALATITDPIKGDIAVVKRALYDGAVSYTYTGYVRNDENWCAMDGNYSADNVYLSSNITLAGDYTQVGNLTKTKTGTAIFETKGKTVAAALTEIFSKRLQPEITNQPSVSIGGTQSGTDVEIGTTITKSGTFTSTFNDGTYTYGYVGDTAGNTRAGVSASAWAAEVKYTAGKSGSIATGTSTSTAYNYSFKLGKAADGADAETVSVNFTTTATHGDGQIARDNLGEESSDHIQIIGGKKRKESTATYTCFRKMFYGTFANKDEMTSDTIRSELTGVKAAAKSSNSLDVTILLGALRVAIAVPAGRSVTSVKDRNGLGAEIISSFKSKTVNVYGAESYAAAEYTVYYLDYASENDKENHYDVTIA